MSDWQSLPRGGGERGIVGLLSCFVLVWGVCLFVCLQVHTIIAVSFLGVEGMVAVSACPAGKGVGVLWLN